MDQGDAHVGLAAVVSAGLGKFSPARQAGVLLRLGEPSRDR
jgi:hypothetical protein